jgi:hypothetical protein
MARQYCSQLNSAESMWGTAEQVDVWLLLEYKPAWQAKVLADNDLAEQTRSWLAQSISRLSDAGYKVRPQFVRQPELDRDDSRLLVAVSERLLEFSGTGYDFLQSLDLLEIVQNARAYPQLEQPRYFVCTNGQRDMCCSRFGLPSYAALRERLGDRVWQVSHLGGHRFAPNVLVLPAGVLYGRVDVECVTEFLQATESNTLDFAHLRGRSRYPAHVQAAEASLGVSGLKLLHVTGDDAAAEVTFATPQESLKVAVQRATQALPVLKSCGDDDAQPMYPYSRA